MVHYTQIASTISSLMGIEVPYSNSGWPLLELYPKNMD
jgi:hypothetical protein